MSSCARRTVRGRIEAATTPHRQPKSYVFPTSMPGAVGFLQRSRILFRRPRYGTNFLIRCHGFTTAVGVSHEVSGHQAFHRRCWPQDEALKEIAKARNV